MSRSAFPHIHYRVIAQSSRQKLIAYTTDKKAREELAGKVGKSKGPMNTGSQGIKKSGKK
jgi:hypothetical protein